MLPDKTGSCPRESKQWEGKTMTEEKRCSKIMTELLRSWLTEDNYVFYFGFGMNSSGLIYIIACVTACCRESMKYVQPEGTTTLILLCFVTITNDLVTLYIADVYELYVTKVLSALGAVEGW